MITKEEFTKFIKNYQVFYNGIERFEKAITGSKYTSNLLESDWGDAVGIMLDTFLDSHLTVDGADWVTYYLFEDVEDKLVTVDEKDLFGINKKEYHLNSINELWNFLLTNPERYFKNYNKDDE